MGVLAGIRACSKGRTRPRRAVRSEDAVKQIYAGSLGIWCLYDKDTVRAPTTRFRRPVNHSRNRSIPLPEDGAPRDDYHHEQRYGHTRTKGSVRVIHTPGQGVV